MYVATVIHEGEIAMAAIGATAEEAEAKLRAIHLRDTVLWYDNEEAAKEAIAEDEEQGNIEFQTCPISE